MNVNCNNKINETTVEIKKEQEFTPKPSQEEVDNWIEDIATVIKKSISKSRERLEIKRH